MPLFRPVVYEPPKPKTVAEDPTQNFSELEITEYKEAFLLFDKNGDGKITSDELKQVMRSLGKQPTNEEVKEMLNNLDIDGDGSLNFNEFLKVMAKKIERGDTEKDIEEAFRIFDKDGNGFINHIELYHVMINLGEKLTPEDAYEMINEADQDGDGMINFQEFRRMMLASQHRPQKEEKKKK